MKNKKSIIIFSPKGGVGKTILTMNLGGILSNLNKKVLLIDLDVFNGGLGLLINKDLTSTIYKLTDDLANNRFKNFNDYVYSYNEFIDILPAPKDPRQGSKIDSKYLDLIMEKAKNNYDYILIDTNSSLNEINLVLLDNSDEILFVVNNDIMTLKNLRNLINIFKDLEKTNYKVILNASNSYKIPYFSMQEMKKILENNIDYTIDTSFFIKDITKLIYDNKIPVLDNFISKKHKGDINKLTKMVLDIIGGEDVEEK